MDERWLWRLLPRQVRIFPADLAAVVIFATITNISVFFASNPLRTLFVFIFIAFLPGYAAVATLFPENGAVDDNSAAGIKPLARIALSLALSVGITPAVGVVLSYTPYRINLYTIIVALDLTILSLTVTAVGRRWQTAKYRRFVVPYRKWINDIQTGVASLTDNQLQDQILNILLIVSLVMLSISVAYSVAAPTPGERYTEFYLLVPSESNQQPIADYPADIPQGSNQSFLINVKNKERTRTQYTLIVKKQDIMLTYGEKTTSGEDTIMRSETEVQHSETWSQEYELNPNKTGKQRLVFLLFRGKVTSGQADPYRRIQLEFTVSTE